MIEIGYGEYRMEERKLIKVIMEYDNGDIEYIEGDIEYIEGDDVEKWQKALNSTLVLDYTHRGHAQNVLKDIVWKRI